jgi:hypothetical protein
MLAFAAIVTLALSPLVAAQSGAYAQVRLLPEVRVGDELNEMCYSAAVLGETNAVRLHRTTLMSAFQLDRSYDVHLWLECVFIILLSGSAIMLTRMIRSLHLSKCVALAMSRWSVADHGVDHL